MTDTLRALTRRVDQLEQIFGIRGFAIEPSMDIIDFPGQLPVGTVVITTTSAHSMNYGTWELLNSGPLLGGGAGTVYAWHRTA